MKATWTIRTHVETGVRQTPYREAYLLIGSPGHPSYRAVCTQLPQEDLRQGGLGESEGEVHRDWEGKGRLPGEGGAFELSFEEWERLRHG